MGMTSYAEETGPSDTGGAAATAGASAEYDELSGSVDVSGVEGSVQTVLVTNTENGSKLTGDNIFYIAQGSALSTAAGFAMMADPEPGTYYLIYNTDGAEDAATVIPFQIGVEVPDTMELTALEGAESDNDDGTFNKGFVANGVALGAYKSLIFTFTEGDTEITMGYSMDDLNPMISGYGSVNLGIMLDNIPAEQKDAEIRMYLSVEPLPDTDSGTGTETTEEVTEE